ncbi:OmpA family protein [Vibrio vulnificus]|uniref:OmpA family protein n=1 Tax=Vibrio vulnificus TaxID=672 RepID=UPI003ED869D5
MKKQSLFACVLLSGCANLIVPPNMLDVAPKTNEELVYPEWGGEEVSPPPPSPQMMQAQKPQVQSDSLQSFLQRNAIQYQILPGDHIMIHLTETIHFKTGSAEVSPVSARWIGLLGNYLNQRSDVDIVIDGHADSTGATGFNNSLSERRAEEVKKQLLMSRVPESRVYTRGYGEYLPACSNTSINGRKCNRRVELMLIVTK